VQQSYVDPEYQFLSVGMIDMVIGVKTSFSRVPTIDNAGSKELHRSHH
jgi:hypothetical protein